MVRTRHEKTSVPSARGGSPVGPSVLSAPIDHQIAFLPLLSHCCHTAADSHCHTDTGGHSNGHVTATCYTDFDRWGQARAIHPINRWRGWREDIDRSPIFDRPHRTGGHVHVVEVATIEMVSTGEGMVTEVKGVHPWTCGTHVDR